MLPPEIRRANDLYAKGIPVKKIGRLCGLSTFAVLRAARAAGLPKRGRKKDGRWSHRRPAFVEAFLAGARPYEIAARFGVSRGYVYQVLYAARRLDDRIPRGKTGKKPKNERIKSVHLPAWLSDDLRPLADARGRTVPELVRDICAAIVDDDIIDAVLDEGA